MTWNHLPVQADTWITPDPLVELYQAALERGIVSSVPSIPADTKISSGSLPSSYLPRLKRLRELIDAELASGRWFIVNEYNGPTDYDIWQLTAEADENLSHPYAFDRKNVFKLALGSSHSTWRTNPDYGHAVFDADLNDTAAVLSLMHTKSIERPTADAGYAGRTQLGNAYGYLGSDPLTCSDTLSAIDGAGWQTVSNTATLISNRASLGRSLWASGPPKSWLVSGHRAQESVRMVMPAKPFTNIAQVWISGVAHGTIRVKNVSPNPNPNYTLGRFPAVLVRGGSSGLPSSYANIASWGSSMGSSVVRQGTVNASDQPQKLAATPLEYFTMASWPLYIMIYIDAILAAESGMCAYWGFGSYDNVDIWERMNFEFGSGTFNPTVPQLAKGLFSKGGVE